MAVGQLPRLTPEEAPVVFPTLGWAMVDWAETFLRHGPGPVIGQPWLDSDDPDLPGLGFDDEEVLHFCWLYRVWPRLDADGEPHPKAGRRMVRKATRVRPKGRRKSEDAGVVALFEGLGPCIFDHWAVEGEVSWWGYRYREGEPVGRPRNFSIVDVYATEEGQAGNTYENVFEMARGREILDSYPGLRAQLGQTDLPAGGRIRPNTSGDMGEEGGKQTTAVFDEVFLWRLPRLKNLHRTVDRNLKKTFKANQCLLYQTSNAHFVGQNSVLEEEYTEALKYASFEEQVHAGIFFDWLEPTDKLVGRAFKSDRRVKRALRELYGAAAEWMDLDVILADIRDPLATEEDSRRAWLNLASSAGSAWLDMSVVQSLIFDDERDKAWRLRPGEPLAGGFDGSRFSDSTALMVMTEKGLLVPWRVWEKKADDGDDWEVDDDEVNAAVDELFETHPIARFYADPFYWETNVSAWAKRNGRAQKNGKAVREWRTNRDTQMALATNDFEVAVKTGGLRFFASGPYGEAMLEHFANTHTRKVTAILDPKVQRHGHVPIKERRGSPRKIDCSPASIICNQARVDAIAANEFRTARRLRRRTAGIGLHPLSK